MNRKPLVYDNLTHCFRDLDETNYNDDSMVGTIFFKRELLQIMKKHFVICGYLFIDNSGNCYPIDIRSNVIAMLEGTYNSLTPIVKEEMINYNLLEKPDKIWSSFFLRWQFLADMSVFDNTDSFISMCSRIVEEKSTFERLTNMRNNIIFPSNYDELCLLAQSVSVLLDIDLYNKEHVEEYNYVIDSLLNGYHINLSFVEVETYSYHISSYICKRMEADNV